MLEVLMYLFENYMEKDTRIAMREVELAEELRQVGYMKSTIQNALKWLSDLNQPLIHSISPDAVRVYHSIERHCLGTEGIALLTMLEQRKILTATQRELVIDRALAMGAGRLSERVLKWIVLMVLFGHSRDRKVLLWMQDFVFSKNSTKH